MSIRIKITLLVVVLTVLIPVGVGYLAFSNSETILKESLDNSFKVKLNSAKLRLLGELRTLLDNSRSWSGQAVMSEIRSYDDDLNIASFLVSNARSYEIIESITVIDIELEVVASSINNLLDYSEVRIADFLQTFGVGSLINMGVAKKAVISADKGGSYVSYPIIDPFSENRENLGRLLIGVSNDVLFQALKELNEKVTSDNYKVNIYLVGDQGIVYQDLASKSSFGPNFFKQEISDKDELIQYESQSGTFYYRSAQISKQESGLDHALTLLIAQPESVILKPSRDLALRIFVVIVIAAVIASFIGIFWGQRIVKPIVALRRTTERIINRDDLSLRVVPASNDEVGELGHSFNSLFDKILESRKKLEQYNKTLQQTVDQRTAELKQAKNSIDEMIDNMKQGVMTFDSDMLVNEHASAFCSQLLGVDAPAGMNIIDLVFDKDSVSDDVRRAASFNLQMLFGNSSLQWEICLLGLPKHIERNTNDKTVLLKITYEAIYDSNAEVSRIMIILEDETELVKAQQESLERQKDLSKLAKLVSVKESVFSTFIEESDFQISESRDQVDEIIENKSEGFSDSIAGLFRNIHTIKGNAGIFNLRDIAEMAHEMESYLDKINKGEVTADSRLFVDISAHLDNIENEINTYKKLRTEILGEAGDDGYKSRVDALLTLASDCLANLNGKIETQQYTELSQRFAWSSYCLQAESFDPYISRYKSFVESIANRLGKQVQPLKTEIEWNYFDRVLAGKVNGFLMHILRNALDHGVEQAELREATGKPPKASISLRISLSGERIQIEVEDDGQGIDVDKLVEKAEELGIIDFETANNLSYQEKLDLLYHSGLSTADQVSEISGRGVGLDAVKSSIEGLGGSLEIVTKSGKGTLFRIQIPLPAEDEGWSGLREVS